MDGVMFTYWFAFCMELLGSLLRMTVLGVNSFVKYLVTKRFYRPN